MCPHPQLKGSSLTWGGDGGEGQIKEYTEPTDEEIREKTMVEEGFLKRLLSLRASFWQAG